MIKLKKSIFIFFCIVLVTVHSKIVTEDGENSTDSKSESEKYYKFSVEIENGFKKIMKGAVRQVMPYLIHMNEITDLSDSCRTALMKYLKDLSQAKLWAVKMLDASSKIPPGFVIGTFADYGSFDECLEVEVPGRRSGDPGFRGSSCAVEAWIPSPPRPKKFTLSKSRMANDTETLGAQFRAFREPMHHKWLRLMACVPSKCSLNDMQLIAQKATNMSGFIFKVPQCYVKEEGITLQPVHYVVLAFLLVLFILCLAGTIVDGICKENMKAQPGPMKKFFLAFSLSSNFSRLVSPSGGSTELKCIHGIRALGMCWIVLGHSYVLIPFDLLKEPYTLKSWFGSLQFELIHNGWLSVETFFLLSGILMSYGGMKSAKKVNGKLNIPLMALRRYVRLTPPVLLLMGLIFFLPLISSGPFWYEQVDPQLESCRNYWWSMLLYISNWMGINKGCILTTWYLAADFQLHVFSLFLLIIIFRYPKCGLSVLVFCVAISCASVGVQTILYDLMPTVLLSRADDEQVFETLDKAHIYTLTHMGPYCIGMLLGYYIYKYREQKPNKVVIAAGWCVSVVLSLSSVLGNHPFATGEETSLSLEILFASVHRTVFTLGVAWVAFACIAGFGGPVNSLLSSSALAPFSRLTFMVYLLHPLVIWTRLGSLRERPVASHYDFVYSFLANLILSFAIAVPFYLLLEAPLSNLDRMIFSRSTKPSENEIIPEKQEQAVSPENLESRAGMFPSKSMCYRL